MKAEVRTGLQCSEVDRKIRSHAASGFVSEWREVCTPLPGKSFRTSCESLLYVRLTASSVRRCVYQPNRKLHYSDPSAPSDGSRLLCLRAMRREKCVKILANRSCHYLLSIWGYLLFFSPSHNPRISPPLRDGRAETTIILSGRTLRQDSASTTSFRYTEKSSSSANPTFIHSKWIIHYHGEMKSAIKQKIKDCNVKEMKIQ